MLSSVHLEHSQLQLERSQLMIATLAQQDPFVLIMVSQLLLPITPPSLDIFTR